MRHASTVFLSGETRGFYPSAEYVNKYATEEALRAQEQAEHEDESELSDVCSRNLKISDVMVREV